ncbi:SDR family NAD(P)-dependent oxidoreductase [Aestuariicella hydrocarbonica]|uniref:SDR family NAD(P)-dependent oxidoreductase n=1 Tax=Pseudomaricurvus hydrocarbonicus TaxID=1470433 RepID=A0A9E5JUI4_9GAMM|nr:SDR family NAD(P)-dependent oxidoreductase [Aestuariicella hydrocarbonica]NHO64815.1 SDR family NAD(P)-dependent oxidoreductase [Aestuariicella hydrocarbonica]
MSEFLGKTAVISGGAEGIALSIARAVGKQGMKVVLGDIDVAQLQLAEQSLRDEGIEVLALPLDVTKPEQWQQIAKAAQERFGNIHMLVNNAGVSGTPGVIEQTNIKDWNWVMDVNLMGVIYGTQTLIPLMKQHSEGGWLINVASMAGMVGVPMGQAYTASKVAVVGMSESWRAELTPHNIQVSVLCPAFVQTRINHASRNKPSEYQTVTDSDKPMSPGRAAMAEHMQKVIDRGLAVEVVGERVIEAIRDNELYIFTHPNYRAVLQKRFQAVDQAFERAAASPLVSHLLDEEIDGFMKG